MCWYIEFLVGGFNPPQIGVKMKKYVKPPPRFIINVGIYDDVFLHYKLFRSPLQCSSSLIQRCISLRQYATVVKGKPSKHDQTPGGNVTTKIQWKGYEQVSKLMIQSYTVYTHLWWASKNDGHNGESQNPRQKLASTTGNHEIKVLLELIFPNQNARGMMEAIRFIVHLVAKHSDPLGTTSGDFPQKGKQSQLLESTELLGTSLLGK